MAKQKLGRRATSMGHSRPGSPGNCPCPREFTVAGGGSEEVSGRGQPRLRGPWFWDTGRGVRRQELGCAHVPVAVEAGEAGERLGSGGRGHKRPLSGTSELCPRVSVFPCHVCGEEKASTGARSTVCPREGPEGTPKRVGHSCHRTRQLLGAWASGRAVEHLGQKI